MNGVQFLELLRIVVMFLLSLLLILMFDFLIFSFIFLSCFLSLEYCIFCICKVVLIFLGVVFDIGVKREVGFVSFLVLELLVSFCLCLYLEQFGYCWLCLFKIKYFWVFQKFLFGKELKVDFLLLSRGLISFGMI